MAMNCARVTKRSWYRNGGFANTTQYRRMRGGVWHYYARAWWGRG